MAPHWLPKNEMTEEDIKLQFITPAIQQQWGPDHITMETNVQLTDGKIELKGNTPVRKKPKRADYVLYQDLFPHDCTKKSGPEEEYQCDHLEETCSSYIASS